ncbi:MAG: tetratricopeptide repeat protein [Myxococcaceae bacterium]
MPAPQDSAAQSYAPGALLNGRYQIVEALPEERTLGAAAFVVVDSIHSERALILELLGGIGAQPSERLVALKRDVARLAQTTDPHLARVYVLEPLRGTDDFVFTRERVVGSDLLTASKGMDWKGIAALLAQVCRGLMALHAQQVHGADLRPTRMCLAEQRARILDALTGAGQTGPWRAPELVVDPDADDPRSDLFSLGVTAFQLLSRIFPFDASNAQSLLQQQCAGNLPWPEPVRQHTPEWLVDLVAQLCARDPADRPRSAAAVLASLVRGAELEPLEEPIIERTLLHPRLIQREESHAQLDSFLDRRLATGARRPPPLLLVRGEAGTGKSRLLREPLLDLRVAGRTCVQVQCFPGASSGHGPLAQLVAGICERLSWEDEAWTRAWAQLAPLAPQLEMPGGKANDASFPTLGGRLEQFEALSDLLLVMASRSPLAIFVHDVHWATGNLTEFLLYLVRKLVQAEAEGMSVSLALVVSARPEELEGTPAASLLTSLEQRSELNALTLPSLDAEGVARLLGACVGVDHAPSPLAHAVLTATGGNPFRTVELARGLLALGAIRLEDGVFRSNLQDDALPSEEKLLQQRLENVAEQERVVLDLLTVCIHPTPAPALGMAARLSPSALHRTLHGLHVSGWLMRPFAGEDLFHFADHRMRERLYSQLPPARRAELHASVGLALELAYSGSRELHLYELAYHFARTGERTRALDYLVRAGERARAERDNHAGILFLSQAILLIGESPTEAGRRLKLLESLADVEFAAGRLGEAEGHLREVLADLGDRLERARILRKLGAVLSNRGATLQATREMALALDELGERWPRSRAGVLVALVLAFVRHQWRRMFPPRRKHALSPEEVRRREEAFDVYHQLGQAFWKHDSRALVLGLIRGYSAIEGTTESPRLSSAYGALAILYGVLGRHEDALKCFDRARANRRTVSAFEDAKLQSMESGARFYMGEWRGAEELALRSRDTLARMGDYYLASANYITLFYVHIYRGEFALAEALARKAQQIFERVGAMVFGYIFDSYSRLASVLRGAGDVAEAIRIQEASIAIARKSGDNLVECTGLMRLGELKWVYGDLRGAQEALDQAREVRESKRILQDFAFHLYPVLALCLLDRLREPGLSDQERSQLSRRASDAVDQACRLSRKRPNHHALSLLARAVLHALSNRAEAARRDFEAAHAEAKRIGSPLWEALTLWEEARWKGDATKLDEARALLDRCEARHWREREEVPTKLDRGD